MSSQYFPPYRCSGGDIKGKLDLSNYATKTDLKNVIHVDTLNFALKTNLISLKTVVDKIDIDKLVPVPIDLAKLSKVVKNDVVTKTQLSTLILGRSLVQELNGKTLYAERMYSPNFTVANKTFVLSLHYNGDNSYLFVNGKEVTKSKARDSEIKSYQLCLDNISKDFSSTSAQKTGL